MSVNVYEDISEQTTKWNEEEGKSAIASILRLVATFVQVHTLWSALGIGCTGCGLVRGENMVDGNLLG